MADNATTANTGAAGNTAVPAHGDHDRVAMLSLRADGTPDQHNPEIIGDKQFALDATREQFKQQAVSAADQAVRGVTARPDAEAVDAPEDPKISELQRAHVQAEQAAQKAADATVDALFTGDPALKSGPAGSDGTALADSGNAGAKNAKK